MARGPRAESRSLPRPEPRDSKGRTRVRRGAPAVAGRSARFSAGHGAADGQGGATPAGRPRAPWREMSGNQATPRQECLASPRLTRQPESQLRAWVGGRARQTHARRLPAGGGRDQQPRRAGCGRTAFPPRKSRLPGQSTAPRRPAVLDKRTAGRPARAQKPLLRGAARVLVPGPLPLQSGSPESEALPAEPKGWALGLGKRRAPAAQRGRPPASQGRRTPRTPSHGALDQPSVRRGEAVGPAVWLLPSRLLPSPRASFPGRRRPQRENPRTRLGVSCLPTVARLKPASPRSWQGLGVPGARAWPRSAGSKAGARRKWRPRRAPGGKAGGCWLRSTCPGGVGVPPLPTHVRQHVRPRREPLRPGLLSRGSRASPGPPAGLAEEGRAAKIQPSVPPLRWELFRCAGPCRCGWGPSWSGEGEAAFYLERKLDF